ncbi:MAG: pilus assembly PilX N-terminal domain-containing protein [bacterium]|nr:pilus assembly PilX N-terminal domain-containing protein [bacterium]
MAIKNRNSAREIRRADSSRGFALFVAIIFMSVMLVFGITLSSLGYKQQILASSAIESQNAFYAADAALECLLYADQKLNLFVHTTPVPSSAPSLTCDGVGAVSSSIDSWNANQWVVSERVSIDSGRLCADVTIYKPDPSAGLRTYLFSRGYNIPCATIANPGKVRFMSRGINASYQ